MASPISNDSPLNVGSAKARAAESEGLGKRRDAVADEAVTSGDDTVTLSETGRRLAVGAEGRGGPQNLEQAQALVERLKEKLAANPGFAAAAHRADQSSRLATLLDSYA
jgi:hypothetical protein